MAATEPLAPDNSSSTDTYTFSVLGKECTVSTAKFCEVDTASRKAFDTDLSGQLSKKEFTAYLRSAVQKSIDDKSGTLGAVASGAVQLCRLALLLCLTLAGLYYGNMLLTNNQAVYEGVDPVGNLAYQYTPPSLASATCTDVSDDIRGEAYARVGSMSVNRDDAKKRYYNALGGYANTDYDIIVTTFKEADPAGGPDPTPIPGIKEVMWYSRPMFSHLYPSYLRAFSLGAWQLKLGMSNVYITGGDCNDAATVKQASVAFAGNLFWAARGSDGLVAVARNMIPADMNMADGTAIADTWPELAESIRISGDFIRFNCGPSGPPFNGVSSFKAHALGGFACTPFSASDLYNDQSNILFLGLDAIIVVCVSIYVLLQLIDLVGDVFVEVVHSIGPEAFIERAGLTAVPPDNAIVKTLLEAAGPLFFIDYIVATPKKCATTMSAGLASAFLHYAFIILPSVPLVMMVYLLGCERADEFDAASEDSCSPRPVSQVVILAVAVQQAAAIAYACSWYLNFPSDLQNMLKWLASRLYVLLSVVTVVYLVQALLLMFIAITVKPGTSISMMVLVFTPFLYAYITASSLANSKPMPPAIDILIACASGAVALYGLVFWLFLAIALFLPPGGNALGPIGASLGTISSAAALGGSQIAKLNKLAAKESPTLSAGYSA